MKSENNGWSTVASLSAFLGGVILLWSFGKSWLNFESALVFLAGLVGVAVAVLLVAAWEIRKRSRTDHK